MSENANEHVLGGIKSLTRTKTDYMIKYKTGESAKLTILNNHVFRFFMSPTGKFPDYPTPNNTTDVAKINSKSVKDYGPEAFDKSYVRDKQHTYIIHTEDINIYFDKTKGTFYVHDKRVNHDILSEHKPIRYNDKETTQTLSQRKKEHFFGGGMQNGRFTHKSGIIRIVNTNDWIDGGVTSPSPFYWTSYGYGVLRNTWQPGQYNFGSGNSEIIKTVHNESHFDAYFFISTQPRHILNDYYELTGQPIFMPEYAFYEVHLNTFNRDYWVEVKPTAKGAIKFEDGKFYKRYKPDELGDKKGILESLNGEINNYQFSARAMIDRYKKHNMPLGWFIPNDGYGSGYGQTKTFAGDLENLKEFIEYANKNGVQVALWTESKLQPNDPQNPKKGERDLSKEVGVGVVALKCDVAWIGAGYSFGLNAVEHATKIYVNRVQTRLRPLIIMVDGWAGTQRYSGIWSGDQTGGHWEYIQFHIPTYIGAGLSGLPVVGSDMDGIYGGGDREVNIRDYQWKTFTPLQLNMDGWGNIPKTPFSFDQEATEINRAYLKLKAMLLPYNYTIAYESLHGLPMMRAMFLEYPKGKSTYTKDCQYQYMWGPNLLVAPVYKKTKSTENELVRHGVYLPDQKQVWTDLFTGKKYQGGKVYNNLKVPLWKIPVFVREGAILPFVNDNNNPHEIKRNYRIFTIYPNGESQFEVYEDDGISADYLKGQHAKTKITSTRSKSNQNGDVHIHIHKTEGHYNKIVKERFTLLQIMTAMKVHKVKVAINGESITMEQADSEHEFDKIKHNVYYHNHQFLINPYLRKFGNEKLFQKCLLIKIQSANVTETEIQVKVAGSTRNDESIILGKSNDINPKLKSPSRFAPSPYGTTAFSITLQWDKTECSFYEIERDETIFTRILGESFTFDEFDPDSEHAFRIRSVNDDGVSEWSHCIIVKTKPDPFKDVVKGVTMNCSISCQSSHANEVSECDKKSLWHKHCGLPFQVNHKTGQVIKLTFDLGKVYEIDKIEYLHREDTGNGTILKIRFRYSIDGEVWSDLSPAIKWEQDESAKVILMKVVTIRFFELDVLESVGVFGSGRQVLFYKKV